VDYYLLFIWGLVEPQLVGPFETPEKRDEEIKNWAPDHDCHGYFTLEVSKGSEIEVDCVSSDLFQ